MGLRDWLVNLLALLGASAVVYGLSLVYLPLAVVAAGLVLILAAVAMARANKA